MLAAKSQMDMSQAEIKFDGEWAEKDMEKQGEFDLGEGDLEVKAMEKSKGDKRVALVEIHFLAWMIELLLQE